MDKSKPSNINHNKLRAKIKGGLFITLEGPEGSGKSTQIKRLRTFLKNKGYSVLYLREPGGTVIGEEIRKVLLNPRNKKMDVSTEALLYLACRAQIVREKIIPALEKGRIVISDRFNDATLAYQGYAGGLNLPFLIKLGKFATCGITPNLTFLLDIETECGLKRSSSGDRMEKKALKFHKKVRAGYLALARKEKKRIFLLKTNKSIGEISSVIRNKTLEFLKERRI